MSIQKLSVLAFGLALSARLEAAVIDFSQITGPGDTESSTLMDGDTGLLVDGFYNAGLGWFPANLFVRDETNDHGLGICNPDETCSFPGGGDINELDNNGAQELIRLTRPRGYDWVSVRVSSLDDNSGRSLERGQLFIDFDGLPTTLDAVLLEFEGGGPVEPTFLIPAFAAQAPFLFFRPFDWDEGTNDNNDFLVYQAVLQPSVPEPATIGLLGLGILALGLRRKR